MLNTLSCNKIKVIGREKYSLEILHQRQEQPKAEKKRNMLLSVHKMLYKKCLEKSYGLSH